jgi:hypothetical protein
MKASRKPTTEVEPLEYKRTQYGYLTIGSLLVIVAILVGVILTAVDPGGRIVLNMLVTAFTLIGLLFMSLTVIVDPSFVKLSFGVGLIRRTIPMARIESALPVRNSWWYGLGIRLTPHGWMWNIQGLNAVELTYTDGGRFRIGTPDPEGLSSAINEFLTA